MHSYRKCNFPSREIKWDSDESSAYLSTLVFRRRATLRMAIIIDVKSYRS